LEIRGSTGITLCGTSEEHTMRQVFGELKKILAFWLSTMLVIATMPHSASSQVSGGYNGQGARLTPAELNALVAPIALYPDALVAQVLGAATFPDQVTAAANFLHENPSLQAQTLMQAVNPQGWDPSVKALTQFPSVLDNMSKNLSWTSALGEAYSSQASDVMTAVQTLRAQAYAAGNLKSGSQITVVQQSPQTIVIQPTNPQVVYVPTYNSTVVYGTAYVTPGYSTGAFAATGLLAFGAGIAVGAAMSGGCCGWGWSSWTCNWHGGAVVYGGGAYYGNAAWHGGYYGSSANAYGPYGSAHYSQGYNPSTGTYARGGSVSTPYGTTSAGQAYNPNTGAYAQTHQTSNAYGSYGNSEYSKNGNTAYSQHQTTANGSTGSVTTSNGGRAYGATGANGNGAAYGQSANGNKYATTTNGSEYKNTGNGWEKNNNGSWSSVQKPSSSSAESRGWGDPTKNSGSSGAFGGNASGWQSRADSSRGSWSRGGGSGGSGGFRR
jgi:hypothetical protein